MLLVFVGERSHQLPNHIQYNNFRVITNKKMNETARTLCESIYIWINIGGLIRGRFRLY